MVFFANFGIGAQILRELGLQKIRLISNNPRRLAALEGFGLSLKLFLIPTESKQRSKKVEVNHEWDFESTVIEGHIDAKGLRLGVVVSRFNAFITEELLEGP